MGFGGHAHIDPITNKVPIAEILGTVPSAIPVPISEGGTGQTVANEARAALGLNIGSDVQEWSANLDDWSSVSVSSITSLIGSKANAGANSDITSLSGLTTPLTLTQGGTGANSASGARTNLGLGDMATQTSSTVSITGGTITGITDLAIADGGTGASTAAGARTNLGLGTMATQDANNVNITGGSITGVSISGGTDLAVADGGTGASTAEGARVNLGCIGILATVGGIDARTTGVTNLYTVPSGKTAIITRVQYRLTAASGLTGTLQVGIGIAANEDDIMPHTNLTAFNTAGETYGFNVAGNYVVGAATNVIKLGLDAAFSAGTGTLAVDLIGYLV